jgi:hypothetical protein
MRLIEKEIPQGDLVEDNIVLVDGKVTYVVYNGYVFIDGEGNIFLRANNNCRVIAGDNVEHVGRGEYQVVA